MSDAMTTLENRPRWVDIGAADPQAAQQFYASLFGWRMDVSPDPTYGGYAMAMLGDRSTAGIGAKMDPNMPTTWNLYMGTEDIDALAAKVTAAGGSVLAPPFEVGDMGRMAVFQDPSGAAFSAWQGVGAAAFIWDVPSAFGWAELNARGAAMVVPFYEQVFGWTAKSSDMGPDLPPYVEFHKDGESILGAWEMNPMVPAEVPNYWQVYFNVEDVDAAVEKAKALGATEMVAAQDFPGGRFAIVTDPQGASFGLLKTAPRA